MPTDRSEWRAVLVGTSRHTGGLPNVDQAANNINDLRTALTEPDGILAEGAVSSVIDPQRGTAVLDAIAAQPACDRLLFYYTGHGMEHEGRLYLALTGSIDQRGHRDRTGLALADVLAQLRAAAHRRSRCRIVVVLDCCFAGLAMREPEAADVHLLTAVGPKNKALVGGERRHTVFTGGLLRLLREGIPDGRQGLELHTVYQRLVVELRQADDGPLTPRQRTVDESGWIALAPNRARGTQLAPAGLRKRARYAQLVGNSGRPEEAAELFAGIVADARRASDIDPADVFDYAYTAVNWLSVAGQADEARQSLEILLAGDLAGCRESDVSQARSTLARLRL